MPINFLNITLRADPKERPRQAELSGRGVGFEAHHLLEKRFAALVGVGLDEIISVALTPRWHRNVGGVGNNLDASIVRRLRDFGINPRAASPKQVWQAHRDVYNDIGYEDWAHAVYDAYFKGTGVDF